MNLEFNDWTPRFYRRMQEEKEAREAWKKLIDRKCNQAVLSLLLWQTEFKKHLDKELEATDIKLQIRAYEASLEVRKLTSTLARLRETYFEIDEEITVAARLCGAIAGHLQGKALTSHPRTQLFDLPLLAVYVRVVTEEEHYPALAALIRCASLQWSRDGKYTADAVRKSVNRYKHQCPLRWQVLNQTIKRYVNSGSEDDVELYVAVSWALGNVKSCGHPDTDRPVLVIRDRDARRRYLRRHGPTECDRLRQQMFTIIRQNFSKSRKVTSQ